MKRKNKYYNLEYLRKIIDKLSDIAKKYLFYFILSKK
jgi:hypothetical protein